jgi:hypothetical protein
VNGKVTRDDGNWYEYRGYFSHLELEAILQLCYCTNNSSIGLIHITQLSQLSSIGPLSANKDEFANNQNLSITVYGIPASVTSAHLLLEHDVDITYTEASTINS